MNSTEQFLSRIDGLYGCSSNAHAQDGSTTTMTSMAMQTQFPSWNVMHKTKRKHSKQRHQNKQLLKKGSSSDAHVSKQADTDTVKPHRILTTMKTESFFYDENNNDINNNSSSCENNNNNNAGNCGSDGSSTNQKAVTDQFAPSSPSRYKGNRRGTYVAEYDPRATLNRPRSNVRSKSMFIRADESGASDLRIQMLLKSFHLDQDGSSSSVTASSDEEFCKQISPQPTRKNSKETELTNKSSPSPSQKSSTVRRCSHKQHRNNNRQKRAHSTFHNLSKEHLTYLEQKYEIGQSGTAAQRAVSLSNDGGLQPSPIHEASKQGDLRKLERLVKEEGCDIQSIDSRGHTPCYYAILNGNFECVSYLVSKGANLQSYFEEQKIRYFKC
jgi:Ankyrin repeat.